MSRLAVGCGVGTLVVTSVVAGQAPVFRTSVDAVTVGVSVRRGNRPVTDLKHADFELTDNGVVQQITELSYETQPIDVTVLLDVSGSVTGAVLDQLRRAVSDLRGDLEAIDRLRLVTFNMRVQRLLDVDDSPDITEETFAAVMPGGSSAVRDALAIALASTADDDRRHFVVLFSDGIDSSSISTPDELLDVARRTSPTVSVVLATAYRPDRDTVYSELAAETGGTVVSLLPDETLGDSLRRVLERFRSSYVLTYIPQGVERPGSHAIGVRVNRQGVTIRARRGYVIR